MAKIIIAGNAVVLTSDLKYEELEKLKKYQPDALILKGGEDGKEPMFRISTGAHGGISKYGVTFSGATRDDAKLATLTLLHDYEGDDIAGFVADKMGASFGYLCDLEAKLPEVIKEIDDKIQRVRDAITDVTAAPASEAAAQE